MKKLRFLVYLAMIYVICEVLSLGAYSMVNRKFFSFKDIQLRQESIFDFSEPDPSAKQRNLQNQTTENFPVIHPYLGFVYDPEVTNKVLKHDGLPVTEYGFIDSKSPIQKRSTNKIIIGIFGGSVAFWQSKLGEETLISELKKSNFFKDKEIVIVRTALGGYRQPQQLLILSYLLSLGAEFDIVINLDGYNDIAVPFFDNMKNKVYPFYPMNWRMLIAGTLDIQTRALEGKVAYLKERRKEIATFIAESWFSKSVSVNTLWFLYDKFSENQINKVYQEYKKHLDQTQEQGYRFTGPARKFSDNPEGYQEIADNWANSSLQMHRICLQNQIKYFHFLQPNQYYPNSKKLSAEEMKIAFGEDYPTRKYVEHGYPYFVAKGVELGKVGVNFNDLTMIFKDMEETTYADNCCHINKRGNEIIARVIAGKVVGATSLVLSKNLIPPEVCLRRNDLG